MPRSIQHNGSDLFSRDAAAIKELCGTTCGMGISGFFIRPWEASGSDTSCTRNVSFFSPEAGDSGAGVTQADNGGENEGGLTGSENSLGGRS
jgi:hypothetical protein